MNALKISVTKEFGIATVISCKHNVGEFNNLSIPLAPDETFSDLRECVAMVIRRKPHTFFMWRDGYFMTPESDEGKVVPNHAVVCIDYCNDYKNPDERYERSKYTVDNSGVRHYASTSTYARG